MSDEITPTPESSLLPEITIEPEPAVEPSAEPAPEIAPEVSGEPQQNQSPEPAPKKSKKAAAAEPAPNCRVLLQWALASATEEKPGDASELDRKYYNLIEEIKRVIAMTNTLY